MSRKYVQGHPPLGPLAVGLLALAIAGCSQFDIRTRQDPSANFASLRTFAWLPRDQAEPADQRVLDPAIDRRIRAAAEADLQAKGYRPAGTAPADFLLNYRFSTSPDDALHGNRGASYAGGLWGGWNGADAVYESYDVGTLYLAALDPRTKQMFWVGAACGRRLQNISYERRAERADTAVAKILESFPKR